MAKIHAGANRANEKEAASFAAELNRMEEDRENRLAQIDAEFKRKKRDLNKSINADQKAIYDDAKKVGVKKAVLRAIVDGQRRIRGFQEKLDGAKEKASDGIHQLEDDDQPYAIGILDAMGNDFAGFGLGAAAVQREGVKPSGGADPIAAAAEKAWAGEKSGKPN